VTEFEKRVLETIETRGLTPRPYAYFLAKRWVFWTLAVLSIVLGSISVAVIIFAVQDYFATGGRGFDKLPLDDVFEYLPFVWLPMFAAFLASAYYAMRQTPNGYIYETWQILQAALVFCCLLGGALHAADAGRRVHGFLIESLPFYEALTRDREKTAPEPDKGILTGTVLSFDGKSALVLRDFTGHTWAVDVAGAKLSLDDPLAPGEDVEIHGIRTGDNSFRAKTIEDWE
jgi:hypothetical protein